jgi:NAD(P)-dependent dehydrogenase (short-subunit alcohol dehydrogenase family)
MSGTSLTTGAANATAGLLTGQVAIVTGASRGIGAAIARAFATAGAAVVLTARDEAALQTVAGAITAGGGEALVAPGDTGDAAAMERLIETTLRRFGRLDCAVNNAGISHQPIPLAEIAVDQFDALLRTNLRGVFLALKYEIPAMIASGGGAIVNISSTAGIDGVKGLADYAASKHGVIGLTKSAALDYAQQNVRVNAIAPGPIVNDRIAAAPAAVQAQIGAAVPMRRVGLPEEVAAAAVWLCSGQSSFVTGATISVDGGRMAGQG